MDEAAETAHPEPENIAVEIQGDAVVREMEEEEMYHELINVVSNGDTVVEVYQLKWWQPAIKATRMWGLDQTGYTFLDPLLLLTFLRDGTGRQATSICRAGR
ncbi:hypothetical protein TSUD_299450 [Trifolium subterraneum]|nr:hypothetical protein TSUD_299450 [Trifolium subterraneum]